LAKFGRFWSKEGGEYRMKETYTKKKTQREKGA